MKEKLKNKRNKSLEPKKWEHKYLTFLSFGNINKYNFKFFSSKDLKKVNKRAKSFESLEIIRQKAKNWPIKLLVNKVKKDINNLEQLKI